MQELKYGFIGGGAIGQAMGSSLRKAGRHVEFWDHNNELCSADSLDDLVESSDVIILAIPSGGVRDTLRKIEAHDKVVLTVAKGVEDGFVTMDKVLGEELDPSNNFGVIYGPMLAAEISAGEGGFGVLATNSPRVAGDICNDFTIGGIRLEASDKLADVAACGTLKNIYALGLGIADGLDFGMNAKAALTVRMVSEMQQVLHALQLDQSTALIDCGLGDLLSTGWGDTSYNRQVGEDVGSGATEGLGGEGLNSLMQVGSVIELSNFPILNRIHHIIVAKAPAEELNDTIR